MRSVLSVWEVSASSTKRRENIPRFPHILVAKPVLGRGVISPHRAIGRTNQNQFGVCRSASKQREISMSVLEKFAGKTPQCPMCASLTKIKELWEVNGEFHQFFKCV